MDCYIYTLQHWGGLAGQPAERGLFLFMNRERCEEKPLKNIIYNKTNSTTTLTGITDVGPFCLGPCALKQKSLGDSPECRKWVFCK